MLMFACPFGFLTVPLVDLLLMGGLSLGKVQTIFF